MTTTGENGPSKFRMMSRPSASSCSLVWPSIGETTANLFNRGVTSYFESFKYELTLSRRLCCPARQSGLFAIILPFQYTQKGMIQAGVEISQAVWSSSSRSSSGLQRAALLLQWATASSCDKSYHAKGSPKPSHSPTIKPERTLISSSTIAHSRHS